MLFYILFLLTSFLSLLGAVPVHSGCNSAPLLLHVSVCVAVCGSSAYLPHADRSEKHQLWSHEILLCYWLGSPCYHYRYKQTHTYTNVCFYISLCSVTCMCAAGLAVGLDPEGYGNPDFCWISMYDKLMWSFAGPVSVVILVLCSSVCLCVLFVPYKGSRLFISISVWMYVVQQ